MDEIETVGIRAFGDAVSSFVRKASLGVRVLISDRGKVVAELSKVGEKEQIQLDPLIGSWVREGKLAVGSGRKFQFPRGEKVLREANILDILNETRGDR